MADLRLLLIGPLPPPLGGATVLFELLGRELKECGNCESAVINSNIDRSSLFSLVRLFSEIYKKSGNADVINLHASYRGLMVMAPFIYFIARLQRKKLIFRLFGGDFNERYTRSNILTRLHIKKILFRADLVLFETQALVKKYERYGNLRWFPNHRPLDPEIKKASEPGEQLRIVFISHIRKEKGIFELIEASKKLPNVIIDVYGPFFDGLTPAIFEGSRISYNGIADHFEVRSILRGYDILILPSYKEGYPGIIIEAFTAGTAVICTNLLTLQEMIKAGKEAVFINPGSHEEIIKAVGLLDSNRNLLMEMKNNCLKKAKMFDSRLWTEKYISYCREILNGCE